MKVIKHLIVFGFVFVGLDSLAQTMSGHYSVGGASPDYSSLEDAKTDLSSRGISSNTYIDIEPGLYDEQIVWGVVPRDNATDTLFIRNSDPKSGKVKFESAQQNSSKNYMFALWLNQPTVFSNIDFISKGLNETGVIELKNNSNHLKFQNCSFTAGIVSAQSIYKYLIYCKTGLNIFNLTIDGCVFKGGDKAIVLDLNASQNKGGNRIQNCEIDSFYTNGIEFRNQQRGGVENCKIAGNGENGIYFWATKDSFDIVNNVISGDFDNGINIQNHSGVSSGFSNVINNVVAVENGRSVYFQGGVKFNYYHNTMVNNSSTIASFEIISAQDYFIKNNIFYNKGSYFSVKYPSFVNVEAGDNLYFSNGSNVMSYQSNPINTVAAIQAIVTNPTAGVNSVIYNPQFGDFESFGLSCSTNDTVRAKANLSQVVDDIDGFVRPSSKPFRGARESISTDGVQLVNYDGYVVDGSDTLKHGKVYFLAEKDDNKLLLDTIGVSNIVDGRYSFSALNSYPFLMKIAPDTVLAKDYVPCYFNQDIVWQGVSIQKPLSCSYSFNIKPLKLYELEAGNNVISGTVISNNTGKTTNPIPGLDVVLDKIPPSTSVAVTRTDANGGYKFEGLPEGVYKITIDYPGLTADTLHEIEISGGGNQVLDMDYCVDVEDKVDVGCIGDVLSLEKLQNAKVSVYPNPSSELIMVKGLDDQLVYKLKIININGQQVYLNNNYQSRNSIEVKELPNGLYLMSLLSETTAVSLRFIKQ